MGSPGRRRNIPHTTVASTRRVTTEWTRRPISARPRRTAIASGRRILGSAPLASQVWPASASTRRAFLRALAQIGRLPMLVEIGAAGLAARNRSRKAPTAMRRALAGIGRAIAEGTDRVEPDIAFHRTAADASDNDYLGRFLRMLPGALRDSIAVARGTTRRRGPEAELAVQARHEAILAAIEARDPAAAKAAMGAHLRFTADQLGLRIQPPEAARP